MYNWQPIKNEQLKWWGVDFDNTIAHNTGFPDFIPLEPLEGCKEALDLIVETGFKITIYTARAWSDYENIEGWCLHHGIPYRRIICGKPLFYTMYDDKNRGTTIDWKEVIKEYRKPLASE